jgi:fatty acid desaturase
VWFDFFRLWIVPLGTSFSFFMILRQIVQHGNAERERYTNTRVFEVHPLISMSVFPIGNDYHLPHHLFPMVPHYNLRKLHALLLEREAYRREAVLVEGYFLPKETPQKNPTVVDVMTQSSPLAPRAADPAVDTTEGQEPSTRGASRLHSDAPRETAQEAQKAGAA